MKKEGTPVKPSDKGYYSSYVCYRDEHYKISSKRRKDYAFPFADGTYGIVKPGDYSPVDGRTVTEEDIAFLHRERDNEVYHNNKYRLRDCDDYDLLEQLDFEKEKMDRSLPNRYADMKEKYDQYRTVIDQGALADDGEGITARNLCGGHIPTPEEALGLMDNPLRDALTELIQSLSDEEYEVYDLVWIKGNSRTTASKMLGISEGTVRYRLSKIREKLGENPTIMSFVDLTGTEKERRQAWLEKQRERKNAGKQ